jgi:peptide/nickel transport system substrate-binding protein
MFSNLRKMAYAGIVAAFAASISGQVLASGAEATVALPADVISLDPAFIGDISSSIVSVNIHETLVMRDGDMNFIPGLAIEWSVSDDQRTWTLKLREGVTFHDGTPLTAAAVVSSFKRLSDPAIGSPRGSMVQPFESVEAVDDLTVRIATKSVLAPFLAQISSKYLAIISPTSPDVGRDYGSNPVGTGPFKFGVRVPGEQVTIVRNDSYWGGAPKIERIAFTAVPEPSSRVLQLMSGEVDMAMAIPPTLLAQIKASDRIKVEQRTGYRTIFLGMNNTLAPFDDIRVRQAVAYAIDIRALHSGVLNGVGTLGGSFESNAISGSNANLPPYPYDPEKSRALLAEAGFANGFDTELYTPVGRYAMDQQMAQAIQAQLAQVGIRAQIRTPEFGTYESMLAKNTQVPLFITGKGSPSGDLNLTMNMSIRTGGTFNNFNYSNPEIDALIDRQASIVDTDERYKVLYEMQEKIYNDYPVVVLYYEDQLIGRKANFQGSVIFADEVVGFSKSHRAAN